MPILPIETVNVAVHEVMMKASKVKETKGMDYVR